MPREDMKTLISSTEVKQLKETFGNKPSFDATEMLQRLIVEADAPEFDYGRAMGVLKEVWYHWSTNLGKQAPKAREAFYQDILHYEEIYSALKKASDEEKDGSI